MPTHHPPCPLVWTRTDDTRAYAQGWGLFNGETDPEIQRDDDKDRFASDDHAILHVVACAHDGDRTARRALAAHCGISIQRRDLGGRRTGRADRERPHDNENDRFPSDDNAILDVVARARDGDRTARRALATQCGLPLHRPGRGRRTKRAT